MATPLELARWAAAAGWTNPAETTIATAVAMRAGSDPNVPGGLYGIGQGKDGASQSQAAHMLWASRNEDWDVFPPHQDGAWRLNLPVAAAAVAGLPAAEVVDRAKDAASGAAQTVGSVGTIAETFTSIGAFLLSDKAWERIIKVTVGSVMILIAVAYIGKRGTFDQGVRMLRFAGRNADFINTARSAGVGRGPTVVPPRARATKTARPRVARKVAAPTAKRAQPRPWSEYPTEPRPAVGRAAPPPRKLPGETAMPRTGLHRKVAGRAERHAAK